MSIGFNTDWSGLAPARLTERERRGRKGEKIQGRSRLDACAAVKTGDARPAACPPGALRGSVGRVTPYATSTRTQNPRGRRTGMSAQGQTPSMDWTHYRFRSLWPLPAPPAAVYRVLERPEEYPRWWRQVREVERTDGATGVIRIRSLLPYDMTFTAREVRRDPGAGVLRIAMSGDIEGWARWTVAAAGAAAWPATTRWWTCASRCCGGWPCRGGRSSGPTTG
ncbi:hypothetical protein GCM10020295_68410 [Streptomyces cinereospinus]